MTKMMIEKVASAICKASGPDCQIRPFSKHHMIAKAAIAAMHEPQDISTAPKDGTEVLLYFDAQGHKNDVTGWIEGWWFSSPKESDDGWETIIGFIGKPKLWLPRPDKP